MSATTSTTTSQPPAPRRSLPSVLADYELHHSPPASAHGEPQVLQEQQQRQQQNANPPSWASDYRRVPPHRPVNGRLDQSQRRVYTDSGERAFLFVMFAGVRTNSTLNSIWRETGGKLNDRIFRYKIGGEW